MHVMMKKRNNIAPIDAPIAITLVLLLSPLRGGDKALRALEGNHEKGIDVLSSLFFFSLDFFFFFVALSLLEDLLFLFLFDDGEDLEESDEDIMTRV